MKKLNLLLLSAMLIGGISSLTSCGEKLINVGILQYATHDALTGAKDGFISALKEKGFEDGKNIKITVQNPEGNTSTMATMARNLTLSSDIVFGIATPAALALKTAIKDYSKDIPLFFTAVTDPVGAGLVTSFTEHGNVTGTSDAGPTEKNIRLFTNFTSVDKIGILWNTAETNSNIQKQETEAACTKFDLGFVDGGITAASQIESKLNSFIASGVKGIFIPTDNMVGGAIASIKQVAIDNKLIVVCADSAATKNGGSLGFSVDYTILGETTGFQAAKVLSSEKEAKDIDVCLAASFPLEINEGFFTATGITIPQAIRDLA